MKASTEDRLGVLSRELRSSLFPMIREIAGPAARPAAIIKRLDIDKSLASRLCRAFRAEAPLEFLHLLPSPTGLRIFLAAAARAKIDPELRGAAGVIVERFQALIDETSGGRATLDATISAYSQEARERNEKSAKRAMYKAMSYLLGIRCETAVTSFIVRPSENGEMVDCIDLHQRTDIRRLRPTAPVGLFSMRLHPKKDETTALPRILTLDGAPAEDVHAFFLEEFSSDPLPGLEIFANGDQTTIALAEDEPAVDDPFSLTSALVLRNVFQHYRSDACRDEWRAYLLHCPCKVLVRDVFIREELYTGTIPDLTLHIPSPKGPETVRHSGLHGKLDTVDLTTPVEYLGRGLDNAPVKEMPSYIRLLRHAFGRTGWNPARFRGYRTKIIYPVPMIYMNWWFSLPERPVSR